MMYIYYKKKNNIDWKSCSGAIKTQAPDQISYLNLWPTMWERKQEGKEINEKHQIWIFSLPSGL